MASVLSAAARKGRKNLRASDNVRLGAGQMLSLDQLARQGDVVERRTLLSVLDKRVKTTTGFLALLLTTFYFVLYCVCLFRHEETTAVWLAESAIRHYVDNAFEPVATVAQLWDVLMDDISDGTFRQQDANGQPLPKSFDNRPGLEGDRWGAWGRVLTYNQIQAAVRYSTERASRTPFGAPYNCNTNLTCRRCVANTGFTAVGMEGPHGGVVQRCGKHASAFQGRQLDLYRPELAGSRADGDVGGVFQFWIFPGDSDQDIHEIKSYYRDRQWIDDDTRSVEIRMYLLNCEMGRPRVMQVTVKLEFSDVGSIFYARDVQTIFLSQYADGSVLGPLLDALWVGMLLLTTFFRCKLAWKAFLQVELFEHLTVFDNFAEWAIVLTGWINFFWLLSAEQAGQAAEVLATVRQKGWDLSSNDQADIDKLFSVMSDHADELGNLRMLLNGYILFLMFRFFVSFSVHPRLALLTLTLEVVMVDMIHFLLVFIPTFVAYVVSGNLLFGRKFDTFATLQASLGTCFHMAIASETEWDEWSEDYYWSVGLWTWSFILIICLLMLNMVLAIIVDAYNVLRESTGSKNAEPIWISCYNMLVRLYHIRHWIPERKLRREVLDDNSPLHKGIIYSDDLLECFPQMPQVQLDGLVADCQQEMAFRAEKSLNKESLLRSAGSVLLSIGRINERVQRMTRSDVDPLTAWVQPQPWKTEAAVGAEASCEPESFLSAPIRVKGRPFAPITPPRDAAAVVADGTAVDAGDASCASFSVSDIPVSSEGQSGGKVGPSPPAWLQEVQDRLRQQRLWLQHAQWQLQRMRWQVQLSHLGAPDAAGERTPL